MFNFKKYDLVAIGDTVYDDFIRLKEAHVAESINHENQEICMTFGDKIPYDFVESCPAVGNSANGAVAAARLGIKTALLTNLGHDELGHECLVQLKKEKIGTDLVSLHRGIKTNHHYVLWFQSERTILIRHEKFPYLIPSSMNEPKWIYLSSLGESSFDFHKTIAEYLTTHPNVKLAFQPGTFQMQFGVGALSEIYKRTEMFGCNVEEAQRILQTEDRDIKNLAAKIHQFGPKIVLITDGPKGAYASHDGKVWFMPPYPDPKPPYERTGAGDAFTSTFMSAIILGKSIEEALLWAPINSMSVVQDIGAQKGLLTQAQIAEWLKKAPEDYKPKLL